MLIPAKQMLGPAVAQQHMGAALRTMVVLCRCTMLKQSGRVGPLVVLIVKRARTKVVLCSSTVRSPHMVLKQSGFAGSQQH